MPTKNLSSLSGFFVASDIKAAVSATFLEKYQDTDPRAVENTGYAIPSWKGSW